MVTTQLIRTVLGLPPLAFVPVGVMYLFWGWQLRRFTLAAAGAILGGLVGIYVSRSAGYPMLICAGIGVLVFGVLAAPLQKVSAFILGGLCGAAFGLVLTGSYLESNVMLFWVILGFITAGGLAVRFFKPIIVIGTSLLGSYCVTHALAFYLHRINTGGGAPYPWPFVVLFFCLMALGIICQYVLAWKEEEPARQAPPEGDFGSGFSGEQTP